MIEFSIGLQAIILALVWIGIRENRREMHRIKRLQRMVFLIRQILNGETASYWNSHLKELADIERELSR